MHIVFIWKKFLYRAFLTTSGELRVVPLGKWTKHNPYQRYKAYTNGQKLFKQENGQWTIHNLHTKDHRQHIYDKEQNHEVAVLPEGAIPVDIKHQNQNYIVTSIPAKAMDHIIPTLSTKLARRIKQQKSEVLFQDIMLLEDMK